MLSTIKTVMTTDYKWTDKKSISYNEQRWFVQLISIYTYIYFTLSFLFCMRSLRNIIMLVISCLKTEFLYIFIYNQSQYLCSKCGIPAGLFWVAIQTVHCLTKDYMQHLIFGDYIPHTYVNDKYMQYILFILLVIFLTYASFFRTFHDFCACTLPLHDCINTGSFVLNFCNKEQK